MAQVKGAGTNTGGNAGAQAGGSGNAGGPRGFSSSDFSSVRQVQAIDAQRTMGLSPSGAHAFTQGNHVSGLADRTALANHGHLQAHELAHVVQQR
ncbi:MAG: DUF4157 domain-containing protein [Phycisphaerales bacterium]|nr:DUF4157 domain-containing protein [Phycisphaerales bacterium]